jgi:hypothetical protein
LCSELLGGLGGVQLVQVVDNQDERITGRADFGQYLVHHGEAVEAGCRGRRLRTAVCAGGVADRAENVEPEQLRVMLAGPHRHEGDRAVLIRSRISSRSISAANAATMNSILSAIVAPSAGSARALDKPVTVGECDEAAGCGPGAKETVEDLDFHNRRTMRLECSHHRGIPRDELPDRVLVEPHAYRSSHDAGHLLEAPSNLL